VTAELLVKIPKIKISSGPTDSDYKIRDGSRFIDWGLAGEGVWEWKWHSPWWGVRGKAPKTSVWGAEFPIAYLSRVPTHVESQGESGN